MNRRSDTRGTLLHNSSIRNLKEPLFSSKKSNQFNDQAYQTSIITLPKSSIFLTKNQSFVPTEEQKLETELDELRAKYDDLCIKLENANNAYHKGLNELITYCKDYDISIHKLTTQSQSSFSSIRSYFVSKINPEIKCNGDYEQYKIEIERLEEKLANLSVKPKEEKSSKTNALIISLNNLETQYKNLEDIIRTGVEFERGESINKIKLLEKQISEISSELTKIKEHLRTGYASDFETENDVINYLSNYLNMIKTDNSKNSEFLSQIQQSIKGIQQELSILNEDVCILKEETSRVESEVFNLSNFYFE